MAVERSHARLGLFLVLVLVVVLATAMLFIQRVRSRSVIAFVTYTTENVSGLDVSSPVRYRGVPLGRVTDLRVDSIWPLVLATATMLAIALLAAYVPARRAARVEPVEALRH